MAPVFVVAVAAIFVVVVMAVFVVVVVVQAVEGLVATLAVMTAAVVVLELVVVILMCQSCRWCLFVVEGVATPNLVQGSRCIRTVQEAIAITGKACEGSGGRGMIMH
eukprot:6200464-Pleurochrysis_carterae.AAC.2